MEQQCIAESCKAYRAAVGQVLSQGFVCLCCWQLFDRGDDGVWNVSSIQDAEDSSRAGALAVMTAFVLVGVAGLLGEEVVEGAEALVPLRR